MIHAIETVQHINDALEQDAAAYIAAADRDYDARIEAIAAQIRDDRAQRPIVLLSGPSGSGKTTTARMIERKLDNWGFETHTLSMDDYFHPLSLEEQALVVQEKLDLEAPTRVDIPFLNAQLETILAGKPTEIPRFSFVHNTRESSGWMLTRKPDELVILEGIHALNPAVITLPDSCTARLYVSVRTRLTAGGAPLHPENIRLLRRMMRDQLFRNRPVAETLRMFDSVQRGETRYILPYKTRASYEVDTFSPYEISVYKELLLPALRTLAGHPAVDEILPVLEQVHPISSALVPSSALIREFIGGSDFH